MGTDSSVQDLFEYCAANGIFTHSSLEAKHVPGAGLGIYASRKLKSGEKIVHVPIKHILTTASIPETFLCKSARKNLAVHVQLAAFLAFGDEADLKPYHVWMATWPPLDDFTSGMPIFWGYWAQRLLDPAQRTIESSAGTKQQPTSNYSAKRRKLSNEDPTTAGNDGLKQRRAHSSNTAEPPFSLSPALTGWTTSATPPTSTLLPAMVAKLASHITTLQTALPHVPITSPANLTRLLHKWCLVNTRCFYYLGPTKPGSRTKQRPPSDPNEAMALVPLMDLFNHTAPRPDPSALTPATSTTAAASPCKVRSSSTGFEVTTTSPVPAGAEILLSYGAHTNDTLWSEYGFLLPGDTNTSDSLPLDEIVLADLTDSDKSALEEHGYLGTYTLQHDGSLCYRTEMVAWLLVLGRQKWAKVVSGGLDPESACTSPTGQERYAAILRMWMCRARDVAEENVEVLERINGQEELARSFGTMSVVLEGWAMTAKEELGVLQKRRDMSLTRWKQVGDMAGRAIQKVNEGVD